MSTSLPKTPSILVAANVRGRLPVIEGALERIRSRFSAEQLLGITLGYRSRDGLLVFVLEPGPSEPEELGALAAAAADLPGLRSLDLGASGPLESLRERALQACSIIIDVQTVKSAMSELRRALQQPEATSPGDARRVPVSYDQPQTFLEVYRRDLAAGTLFVSSEGEKPPIGAAIALEIFVPGDPSPIRVLAKVIHHGDLAGPGYGTRVALTDLARERLKLAAQRIQESSSSREVRHEPRVRAKLGVTFRSGSDVARTWTQDISKGGVFVATPNPPPIGTQVDLDLELPGGEELRIAATVVRLVHEAQAKEWNREVGCGLSFQAVSSEIRSKLEAFVEAEEIKPAARVLLVDDAAVFRTILGDELASRGCEILEASNGAEAFERLVDELFTLDLLVLDLVLPNTSGTELLDRIRRLGGESELAIAVVAGSAEDPGVQRRVAAAGANEVLPKSIPVAEIADRLMALIRGEHPNDS